MGRRGEAVYFNAHERKRSPAGECPRSLCLEVSLAHIDLGARTRGKTYKPQIETRMVAVRRDLTNGVSDIAAAKIK